MNRASIDCRKLLCPMPVIRVQQRVQELAPGDELEAICSDPGVLQDIPAWCRVNGHEVLATQSEGAEYRVLLRVGE